mgnify:CR=1 FL=1
MQAVPFLHNEKKGDNGVRNWHDGVFFGLHFDIHANAADQHLGRDVTVDHLLEQFQKIRPDFVQCDCKGHPGYASYPTKVGVPAPGIEKDALRVWREATKRLGIPLVMHFSGVWDQAAVERHPEWARVPSERERASGEARREVSTCPLSPYTDYMIAQMLELVREYDVDGFWVDGENWATRPCYCERCTQRFCAETGAQTAPLKRGSNWVQAQPAGLQMISAILQSNILAAWAVRMTRAVSTPPPVPPNATMGSI